MAERTNEAIWIESRQRWQINVQQDGDRHTFSSSKAGTRGKVEAEKKADEWLENQNNKDRRFQIVWAEFIEEMKKRTGKENWKKHDQMGRLWLLPEAKHKKVSKITVQNWQNCINAGFKKGLSKKSLENIRGSVTAFYNYCKNNKLKMGDPSGVVIPRGAPVGVRKILQPDQLRTLFAFDTIMHYKKQKHCFYIHAWRFEVLTGLRPGEVAGIEKAKDLREQLLQVQRSINQQNETTRGKNDNAQRDMKLTRRALAVLAAQSQMLKDMGVKSRWAFPDEDGNHMKSTVSYKRWLTYRKQHGITSSLYELRHTMMSIAKSDMPEELMKRIVGHSKAMPTYGVYGHEVDGDLERAADILEAVFDKILG